MPDDLRVDVRVTFRPDTILLFGSPTNDGIAALQVLQRVLVEAMVDTGWRAEDFDLRVEAMRVR